MKKAVCILAVASVVIISAASCKKTSAGTDLSQWTFNNKTHMGTSTVFASVAGCSLIESDEVIDSTTNLVIVEFGSVPVNNEKFGVAAYNYPLTSTQCLIV